MMESQRRKDERELTFILSSMTALSGQQDKTRSNAPNQLCCEADAAW